MALAIGCGPASPQPSTATPVAADVPGATVAGGSTFDVSPVAEPAEIVGIARWKSPTATLTQLASCAGLPSQLVTGGVRAGSQMLIAEAMAGRADVAQLAGVVALDAPVDAIVTLDGAQKRRQPMVAVAIGVTSLERARSAFEAVAPITEVSPGLWRVGGKGRNEPVCALAASAGTTPARLVCAEKERDVLALAPYLARTLPVTAAPSADLHAQVRFRPLEAQFGGMLKQQLRGLPILVESQLSMGEPKFDRSLRDAAAGLQDELSALIGDLDEVRVDLTVAPSSCLTVSSGLALRGKASWLSGAMADGAERAGPPPAIYWRAPKDSGSALYGRGADPARYLPILRAARGLAEGALNKHAVGSPADRKALVELLAMPFKKETNSVQASGSSEPKVKDATRATPQQLVEEMARTWVGWTLIGVDEGPAALTKQWKDVVAVYNRAGLQAPLRKEMGDDARYLPKVKIVPAPASLGRGAMGIEIKFTDLPVPSELAAKLDDRAKETKVAITLHALVMGDGESSWLALGVDRDELVWRLLAAKSGAPESGTLKSRKGLEPLRAGKHTSAGFFTLAPLARSLEGSMGHIESLSPAGGVPSEVREVARLLKTLPHRGDAPMFFTTTVEPGTGVRGEIAFSVPQAAMEDIGAIVLGALRMAGLNAP